MDERYLNFNQFIKQRAIQITRFSEALQNSTSKRTHQSLPKSVRRRAMSHNRYRIPLKMRRQLGQELVKAESMQKIPKCRKSIRKKHRLILSYKARNCKQRWLSTHLWAAKRMRMGLYCGYKIAQTPNNKSFRSSYRHFRHNSCLVDCTYFQSLTIRCKKNSAQCQIPPQLKLGKKLKAEEKYNFFYEGSLVDHENGAVFICPLLIFFESNAVIRCIFDPFCLQQVVQMKWATQNFDIQIGKNKTELYLLLGPQSLKRVDEVFTNLGLKSTIDSDRNNLQMVSHKLFYTGAQTIQKVNQSKNLISKPMTEKIAEGYDIKSNKRMREQFYSTLNEKRQIIGQKVEENKFWQFYDKKGDIQIQQEASLVQSIMKITNRSKYTHKRKNKLTKEEKKKILDENVESSVKKSHRKEQFSISQPQQQLGDPQQPVCLNEKVEQKKTQEYDPILIAPFVFEKSKQQMMQGCFLFCSSRNADKIWKTITHTNIKTIGRKELKHLYFEASVRSYPEDFVESVSFQRFNEGRTIENIRRYKALPPQKRTSFVSINSPFPFCFYVPKDMDGVNAVRIEMVSRGKCPTGSYICKLETEDYDMITRSIEEEGDIKSVVLEQKAGDRESRGRDDVGDLTYEKLMNNVRNSGIGMKRKIIGFVTSGGFKYSERKEGGLGYLFEPQGEWQMNQQYVLIRKVTSRSYYLGVITQNA